MKAKEVIAVVATCDTKGEIAAYILRGIREYGVDALLIDTGILGDPMGVTPDVSRHEVAGEADFTIQGLIAKGSRGAAVEGMCEGLSRIVRRLHDEGRIQGLIAIGGAEGALLGRSAMDALPLGVPKLTVSTIASGRHFFSDIIRSNDAMVMHSVIDILGVDSISRMVFDNAVGAMTGMVRAKHHPSEILPRVGITMLGTTTPPIINVIKPGLEERGFEALTFHANGVGGQAMDDLVSQGFFSGIIDFSPNEIVASLFGGLHAPRPYRMVPCLESGLPLLVAPGSSSIIVLSREEALAEKFARRPRYFHNAEITLVRMTRDEMATFGVALTRLMNRAKGPARFLYPARGFSSRDKEGLELYDPEGNLVFLEALKGELSPKIPVVEIDAHINDDPFAEATLTHFLEMIPPTDGNPIPPGGTKR